jgi:hypothetical protein
VNVCTPENQTSQHSRRSNKRKKGTRKVDLAKERDGIKKKRKKVNGSDKSIDQRQA